MKLFSNLFKSSDASCGLVLIQSTLKTVETSYIYYLTQQMIPLITTLLLKQYFAFLPKCRDFAFSSQNAETSCFHQNEETLHSHLKTQRLRVLISKRRDIVFLLKHRDFALSSQNAETSCFHQNAVTSRFRQNAETSRSHLKTQRLHVFTKTR